MEKSLEKKIMEQKEKIRESTSDCSFYQYELQELCKRFLDNKYYNYNFVAKIKDMNITLEENNKYGFIERYENNMKYCEFFREEKDNEFIPMLERKESLLLKQIISTLDILCKKSFIYEAYFMTLKDLELEKDNTEDLLNIEI